MFICENCRKEFEDDWRKDKRSVKRNPIPKFCCRGCSNSRGWSTEEKAEQSRRSKELWKNPDYLKKMKGRKNGGFVTMSPEKRKEAAKKTGIKNSENSRKRKEKLVLEKKYEEMTKLFLREVLLIECENTCENCGNSLWNGEQIPLEVHHKDNNNKNNRRDNLEVLCLNCHFQTDNYRFRGRTRHKRILI